MSTDQIGVEEEAVQSLAEHLAQAKKCRTLYERANMALPEPLKRVLGMNGLGRTVPVPLRIPPLERHTRPPEAQENWISVETKYTTPTTLGAAILRASRKA